MTEEGTTPQSHHGLDTELGRLRARAAEMGTWALGMVHDGWQAFRSGDLELAQKVLDRDTELDRFDQDLEHEVIGFLVLRQPVAGDLRVAAALLKGTTHLDRIGRLGFDMARIATSPEAREPAELTEILEAMDTAVEAMVRQSLEALARGDAEAAKAIFPRDDAVDRMHREATRRIVRELISDPLLAPRLSGYLLVARHFERIADNACKIGERVIYAATGQRRGEYLPRHPYRPYALEKPRDP